VHAVLAPQPVGQPLRRGPDQPAAAAQVADAAEQPGGRVPRLPDRGPDRVAKDHPARLCHRDERREASVATHIFAEFHKKRFNGPLIMIDRRKRSHVKRSDVE